MNALCRLRESLPDIVYRIAQDITYEEVRIDAAYCATLEEVENAFVKHATLDLA